MKTANEINTLMFKVVNESPLKAAINGSVYKSLRPINANKEDVVINTVVSDAELVQTAVCNVNIHVPSLTTPDGKMPNSARFDELSGIANQILKDGHTKYFTYYTENTAQIQEQNRDEWYLNFRIRFRFHNTIQ